VPTRKQRRRRQKELRHEWEEVYVDAEGRELAPEEVEELQPEAATTRPERKAPARTQAKGKDGRAQRQPRGIQPPSWRRVLKRALIFAPLMYLFIAFTNRGSSAVVNLVITLQLLLIFLPFSYLMDSVTYRLWKRREEKRSG
jgi:hypothetical protein